MKKPRIHYTYDGQAYDVPEQYIYALHESKGVGYEINVDFYTYAFNLHSISVSGYETLYANQSNLNKGAKTKQEKEEVPVGITYFAVQCQGKDRKGNVKTGVGEVSNESINNFQRSFPFGLAAKRAKVNMGKEFFNLHDIDANVDCEDFLCTTGKYKGMELSAIYKKDKQFITATAGGTIDADDLTIFKCNELLKRIDDYRKSKVQSKEK